MPGYRQLPGAGMAAGKRKVENTDIVEISPSLFAIPLLWYKHQYVFGAYLVFYLL